MADMFKGANRNRSHQPNDSIGCVTRLSVRQAFRMALSLSQDTEQFIR